MAERQFSGKEHPLLLQRAWVQFPSPIWAAQSYRNSGSRGSDTLFRPFQACLHTPASTHIRNVKEYTQETAEPSLNITGSQKFVLKTVSLRNNSAISSVQVNNIGLVTGSVTSTITERFPCLRKRPMLLAVTLILHLLSLTYQFTWLCLFPTFQITGII